MRYMMIVKGDKSYEAGAPPKPELMAAVGKLSEEMIKAGVLLDMGGLLPTSKGALINVKKGKLIVTDGPFSETKEVVGGFVIIEAKDYDEAVEIARLHPAARMGEELGWGIELRAMEHCQLIEAAKSGRS